MKKYILILLIASLFSSSCSQSKDPKQQCIADFKSDIKIIKDSSMFYLDKGITLLKEGVDPTEIAAEIDSKLNYYRIEQNKKSKEFRIKLDELGVSQVVYDTVTRKVLLEDFRDNVKKFRYLIKKGVQLN
ncbi:MAG: hypothetical protein AB8B65_09795 [Kordia sp.]|uniref:hypothetical protein n=1 Tax=Kordia sp. TaxID=1965332 RepID=UPI00385E883F